MHRHRLFNLHPLQFWKPNMIWNYSNSSVWRCRSPQQNAAPNQTIVIQLFILCLGEAHGFFTEIPGKKYLFQESLSIFFKRSIARSQRLPSSQALIAALYVMTSGCSCWCRSLRAKTCSQSMAMATSTNCKWFPGFLSKNGIFHFDAMPLCYVGITRV